MNAFMGVPTKYTMVKAGLDGFLNMSDRVLYWIYWAGIYTGDNSKEQGKYAATIGLLFFGLFIEKAAINWL